MIIACGPVRVWVWLDVMNICYISQGCDRLWACAKAQAHTHILENGLSNGTRRHTFSDREQVP